MGERAILRCNFDLKTPPGGLPPIYATLTKDKREDDFSNYTPPYLRFDDIYGVDARQISPLAIACSDCLHADALGYAPLRVTWL